MVNWQCYTTEDIMKFCNNFYKRKKRNEKKRRNVVPLTHF